MYNWNTDTQKLRGNKRLLWRLEQLINFGLNGEKINARELKKNWKELHLDPKRKKFLELITL